jgi:hypothetical protein
MAQMLSRQQTVAALRQLAEFLEQADVASEDDDLWEALLAINLPLPLRMTGIEHKLDRLLEHLERRSSFDCRFSGADGDNVIQLLTGRGQRAGAVEFLRGCFKGARQLTICDPWFLKPPAATLPDNYVREIGTLLPETLCRLEIFVGKRQRNKGVANGINALCRERKIRIARFITDEIHDRVWIADDGRAYVIGTSFNGLGNKCAFILCLPDKDKRLFMDEINKRRVGKSRSV